MAQFTVDCGSLESLLHNIPPHQLAKLSLFQAFTELLGVPPETVSEKDKTETLEQANLIINFP